MLCLTFEVARQVHSPIVCGPVQAVPWVDEGEQELSRITPSVWELSGYVCTFWAGLRQASRVDADGMFEV